MAVAFDIKAIEKSPEKLRVSTVVVGKFWVRA